MPARGWDKTRIRNYGIAEAEKRIKCNSVFPDPPFIPTLPARSRDISQNVEANIFRLFPNEKCLNFSVNGIKQNIIVINQNNA